jgi:hypothetical protein
MGVSLKGEIIRRSQVMPTMMKGKDKGPIKANKGLGRGGASTWEIIAKALNDRKR